MEPASIANATGYPEVQPWINGLSHYTGSAKSDPTIRGSIYGFCVVSLVLTTVTTCIRIYTKFHFFKVRRWDDYLMIASWCGLVCMWGFLLASIKYGAGYHFEYIRPSQAPGFLKYAFLHEIFYAIVQCLLKTSIALQILHIFVPNLGSRSSRTAKFWTIVLFTALQDIWFMIFFWISIFQCDPVKKAFNPLGVRGHCIKGWNEYNITVSTWNMVSDILMLVFPMICVWRLKMQLRFKLDAAGVFFVGALAVAASLLRLIFTIRRLHTTDYTIVLTQIALCDTGEITAGIIVGNFVPLPRFVFEISQKIKVMIHGPSARLQNCASTMTSVSVATVPTTPGGNQHHRHGPSRRLTARSSQIMSFEELMHASSTESSSTIS